MTQTHSGWIDLTLGIGITGIGLILGALGLVMYWIIKNSDKNGARSLQAIWSSRLFWVLWALLLLWCTSEISLKIHIIALMFWISFSAGIGWTSTSRETRK
jgi:O-antigen ligase